MCAPVTISVSPVAMSPPGPRDACLLCSLLCHKCHVHRTLQSCAVCIQGLRKVHSVFPVCNLLTKRKTATSRSCDEDFCLGRTHITKHSRCQQVQQQGEPSMCHWSQAWRVVSLLEANCIYSFKESMLFRWTKCISMPSLGQITCSLPSHNAFHSLLVISLQILCTNLTYSSPFLYLSRYPEHSP